MGDVTLPTPGEVEEMRARHVPDRAGLTTCDTCPQHWPCDAARLLALVDSVQVAEGEACEHPDHWFDRVVCGGCDGMHHYCSDCGVRLDECETGEAT